MNLKLKNKKIFVTLSVVVFSAVFFLIPIPSFAGVGSVVATVFGWILYPIVWLLGKITVMLFSILIDVAQYNDFVGSNAVSTGWVVVRDLCNIFFVLILLIIAFATILRVEQYNLKTWLPKLIIMSVLINFSKTICGIFIDIAQVIMLTFVNAFKEMAGANLTEMMGITKMLSFEESTSEDVSGWTILGGIILALIFLIVALVVTLTMLVMLAMRIIMIWIYVVLSPLAYLLGSFPQGQLYSQRWWSDFSKNLIVGPLMAFFIWLSFSSLGGVTGSADVRRMNIKSSEGNISAGVTEAGSSEHMIKFVISIGMLLGGLMLAQEMGGVVGKVAGKGMAKLQSIGAGSVKVGGKALRSAGRRTGETALKAAGKTPGLKDTKMGRFAGAWGKDMKEARKDRGQKRMGNAMAAMGMGKNAARAGQELTKSMKDSLNAIPAPKTPRQAFKEGRENRAADLQKEGSEMIHKGEVMLKLADDLESANNEQKGLNMQLEQMNRAGIADNDPRRQKLQSDINENNLYLNSLKKNAGINSEDAVDDQTIKGLRSEGEGLKKFGEEIKKDGDDLQNKVLEKRPSTRRKLAEAPELRARGQELVKEGQREREQGENKIKQAEKLETAQSEYKSLENELRNMPENDPRRAEVQSRLDSSAAELKNLKKSAGLEEAAGDNEVARRIFSMRSQGNEQVEGGKSLEDEGGKKIKNADRVEKNALKKQNRGLGTLLVGSAHEAFKEKNKDYNEAGKFVKSLAEETPDIASISPGKFSSFGGDLNSSQKINWEALADKSNPDSELALDNLLKSINNALFEQGDDGQMMPKASVSGSSIGSVKAIARGIKTFKEANGGPLPSGFSKIEDGIDRYTRQSGDDRLKPVDSYSVGSYRSSGDKKENREMNIEDSGIGSINEFGRDRGQSDTISYNFDKLQSKGINIDSAAEGVYLHERETKEKVKVEIIADIDKELNNLRSKASEGVQLSPAESRKEKMLEGAKNRLERGDDFNLVNANKKMGVSEAVVTKRHESLHQATDIARQKGGITPTKSQRDQEEILVEHFGVQAREKSISDKSMDDVVAKIIVDGQQGGLSVDDIKAKIDVTMDKAVRAEKVSSIIEKEKQSLSVSPASKEAGSLSATVTHHVSGGNADNLDAMTDNIVKEIEKNTKEVKDELKNAFRGVSGIKEEISGLKVRNSVQDRLNAYRWSKKK